jgi:ribosomal protein S18 acetylase RimI-like enzyme
MTVSVRPLETGDIGPVVKFSVRAWEPVFESMCRVMGSEIFKRVYPDWATGQAQAVESVCRAEGNLVWVAVEDGAPVGFVAIALREQGSAKSGEIEMVAVDPECQSRGIGLALVSRAVEEFSELGVPLAEIWTGGDPGHAAARRLYEKAGFTALPLVHYYKALPGPAA